MNNAPDLKNLSQRTKVQEKPEPAGSQPPSNPPPMSNPNGESPSGQLSNEPPSPDSRESAAGQMPNGEASASPGSPGNSDDDWMRDAFSERAPRHNPMGLSMGPERLSADEWFSLFCLPFAVARGVVAQQAGHDLQSLAVTRETPGAPDAAKSAFELCLQVPWLEPITRKDGGVAVHAIALGAFVVNVAQAAHMELKAARAKDVTPKEAKPHPDDVAGAGSL